MKCGADMQKKQEAVWQHLERHVNHDAVQSHRIHRMNHSGQGWVFWGGVRGDVEGIYGGSVRVGVGIARSAHMGPLGHPNDDREPVR